MERWKQRKRQGSQEGRQVQRRKGGNQGEGKGKGKKGQRLNEITEPPEEQWKGGCWEQRSDQSWNVEADAASWREDDWYTADSNSQASAALLLVNCDFRILVLPDTLNLFSLTDWILRSELSHLVLIQLHANCCSCQSPCCTWIFDSHRHCTALQTETCLDGTGKPMVIESRKINCRRPLMVVIEMTYCRTATTKFQFRYDNRAKDRFHANTWWMGSDDDDGATRERANKMLSKAFQEISEK